MILYVCKVQTQVKLSMLLRDTYLCINTVKERKNNIYRKTKIALRLPLGGKEGDATEQRRSLDDARFLKVGRSHVVACLIILETSNL